MDLPGPLVDAAWLAERIDADGLVVADVRWRADGSGPDAYEGGHIPGAIFVDEDSDLAAPLAPRGSRGPVGGRHPLPGPDAFAASMRRLGIGDDDVVIAYDDTQDSNAVRLWWMLDAIGHPVAVLDGGLAAWRGPLQSDPPIARQEASFTARPWPPDRLIDAAELERRLNDPGCLVLDARSAERYRAEAEPLDPVAGHIPGAVSAPWPGNVDPGTGRFLTAPELRAFFEALGASADGDVVSYCGSGITACHDLLALRIAGLGPGRLYAGSWSDWISDPRRPVATGPERS